MRTFQLCDQGMAGLHWPDGRALLDQPNRLIQAFSVIADSLHRNRPKT